MFWAKYDQSYDDQHTGRFAWGNFAKRGSHGSAMLLEINLRREFDDIIDDGVLLDYRIAGHDVDCKYSQSDGKWTALSSVSSSSCCSSRSPGAAFILFLAADVRLTARDVRKRTGSHAYRFSYVGWSWRV